jgi:hypothetical protein
MHKGYHSLETASGEMANPSTQCPARAFGLNEK